MTEKIYLETFEKCPGLVSFPVLLTSFISLFMVADSIVYIMQKKQKHYTFIFRYVYNNCISF